MMKMLQTTHRFQNFIRDDEPVDEEPSRLDELLLDLEDALADASAGGVSSALHVLHNSIHA